MPCAWILFPVPRIPQLDLLATRGYKAFAIRREGDRRDLARVPYERVALLSTDKVPQSNRHIPASCRQTLAIRREGQTIDKTRMTLKRSCPAPRIRIP